MTSLSCAHSPCSPLGTALMPPYGLAFMLPADLDIGLFLLVFVLDSFPYGSAVNFKFSRVV